MIPMSRLPEKMRKTLERVVNELKAKANVYGVGLFGSWSRSDATESSDVDLFVLSKSDFDYEYVERLHSGGFFVDLDFVPRKLLHGAIPPEIDQKLYEMQILYDRDWLLTNSKLMMVKSYGSPERVDIRTEAHLLNSDIYLSRATSAFSREDFRSAYLFAVVALENVLGIIADIAMEPFSNSHFIEQMERATARLDMPGLFHKYLEISRQNNVEGTGIKDKIRLFKTVWEEISITARSSPQRLLSSHFKVRTKLNYYLNPAFLQGVILRTSSLIDSEKMIEASHYLTSIFLDIAENYAWLKSSIVNFKIDYTTLISSLKNLEAKNPKNYNQILDLLNLNNVEKAEASDTIAKTRETALKIRKDRKVLIKNQLIKS
jgi:predicted nucleotidyltransferase